MGFAKPARVRVLVVGESAERAQALCERLRQERCEAEWRATLPDAAHAPACDLLAVDAPEPGAQLLARLAVVACDTAVAIFSADASPQTIREATRAGACAYVVDGEERRQLRPVLEAALARFAQVRLLRKELAEAKARLAERKLIERAKGILMKRRGMDEEAAYAFLRATAMARGLKLAEVAQRVLDASGLLDGA